MPVPLNKKADNFAATREILLHPGSLWKGMTIIRIRFKIDWIATDKAIK